MVFKFLLVMVSTMLCLSCKHYKEIKPESLKPGLYKIDDFGYDGFKGLKGGNYLKISTDSLIKFKLMAVSVTNCEPVRSFCTQEIYKYEENWICPQYYQSSYLVPRKSRGYLEVDSLGYVKINGKPYYFEHQIECVDSLSTQG